jgi:hypothetical protein
MKTPVDQSSVQRRVINCDQLLSSSTGSTSGTYSKVHSIAIHTKDLTESQFQDVYRRCVSARLTHVVTDTPLSRQ